VRLRQTGAFGGAGKSDWGSHNAFRVCASSITRREKLRQTVSQAARFKPVSESAAEKRKRPGLIQSALVLSVSRGRRRKHLACFYVLTPAFPRRCESFARITPQSWYRAGFSRDQIVAADSIGQPVTIRQSDELSDEWERQYRASGAVE
jgi:hypothetical protein